MSRCAATALCAALAAVAGVGAMPAAAQAGNGSPDPLTGVVAGSAAAGTRAGSSADAMIAIGEVPFADHRDPPAYLPLPQQAQDQYELGHEVFNTDFLPAGTPNAGRRAGVGPLFNAPSCDECHNEGARGRGPVGDGPAPQALVVQLEAPFSPAPRLAGVVEAPGDPVYGRVFNTAALRGVEPEGEVRIQYRRIEGRYPDGSPWELREPHYLLTDLHYGELAPTTLIKPRLAPALFGVGLLEAVRAAGGERARDGAGRFGWQGSAHSIRDQTTRAFSREMGLTSADRRFDDCTPAQVACLKHQGGEAPEVSAQLLDAVVVFQQWLAVPQGPHPARPDDPGAKLFTRVGCEGCHQVRQQVVLQVPGGASLRAVITAYTDLKLHYLGPGLSDSDVSGQRAASRWRTPALWGLDYRLGRESFPTFLHDGRARSVEEAVLWHDGEAAAVRLRFEQLPRAQRAALVRWVDAL